MKIHQLQNVLIHQLPKFINYKMFISSLIHQLVFLLHQLAKFINLQNVLLHQLKNFINYKMFYFINYEISSTTKCFTSSIINFKEKQLRLDYIWIMYYYSSIFFYATMIPIEKLCEGKL